MNKIERFWCHDASNIRCVRESDYDALAAENKRLREALATAGKGVHWMQAHVPMTEKAQWKAYETRRVIEAALAGSKEGE